ncbi:MAG: hypothetical protein ABI863_17700 [Ginsengibacter sp.]
MKTPGKANEKDIPQIKMNDGNPDSTNRLMAEKSTFNIAGNRVLRFAVTRRKRWRCCNLNFLSVRYLVLFILSLLLYSNPLFAQSPRSIRVKAGENIAQAYPPNGFYRFPKFSKAILFYKGGTQNAVQLFNYNILSGTMQFISPAGKTFDIADPANIDSVVFEKIVFVHNEGFMEIVTHTDSIILLKKIIIKTREEKIGALGLPAQSSSIDNISIYSAETDVYNLTINTDVVVIENVYWYWMDNNHNLLKATKGNLLRLLPAPKQNAAETYMKQNKINFENENDLKQLMVNLVAGK